MNKSVITISGEICTGKSTTTKNLLRYLPNWKYTSTGQRLREYCAAKGMSIQEVSYVSDEIHREFDRMQKVTAETESQLILEGRLTGWLTRDLPHVFRVYCYAPLDVRIERYMKRENTTEDKARSDIQYRDTRDLLKFKRVYDVHDYRAKEFYSIVIDTSKHSPEEIARVILEKANLVKVI